ncbi:hypothetical protein Sjap_011595 [Stephania japonica]|uniref:DUF8040 domain-containing protein n=1 Tax=Stephania japonica TaxID=461633 RepID=A0AAP0P558_9MAGN
MAVEHLVYKSDDKCYKMLRMDRLRFNKLRDMLYEHGNLRDKRCVLVDEHLAITLHILGHNVRNRVISTWFQRSGDTVSKVFRRTIRAIIRYYWAEIIVHRKDGPKSLHGAWALRHSLGVGYGNSKTNEFWDFLSDSTSHLHGSNSAFTKGAILDPRGIHLTSAITRIAHSKMRYSCKQRHICNDPRMFRGCGDSGRPLGTISELPRPIGAVARRVGSGQTQQQQKNPTITVDT